MRPQTPPPLDVPQDVDFDELDQRVLTLPSGLWSVAFGLLALATKAQYFRDDPFGATGEQCARAFSEMIGKHSMTAIPIGTILDFMGDTPPEGFLICNGKTYLRDDYPELYEILPTSFIINADEFITPDLRTRFTAGTPDSTSTGNTGGANSVTIGVNNLPSHNHAYFRPVIGATLIGEIPSIGVNGVSLSSTDSTGGGEAIDNRPAFMYVERIIRAKP